MKQLVPICPYAMETNTANKIFFSYRGVQDFYPLHGHDYYELELIVSGSGRQWVNNVCVPLEKGSLYLVTPSDIHRVEADESLYVLSIHFLPEIAEQMDFSKVQDAWAMVLNDGDFELFSRLAFSVIDEKNKDVPYHVHQMLSVTMLLLVHLLRGGTKYAAAPASQHMQEVLRYIHENYSNPNLRLKDAAEVGGLSTCHFSTTFRSVVGCGFSEYLLSYRLRRASMLLADLNISVTEVAYEVGFSTLSHFFRVFRDAYGCTPKQYRQKALAESSNTADQEKVRWVSVLTPAPEYA